MSKLRNAFIIFLFALFLFQIVSVVSTESSVLAEEIVYGDVNLDGEVNSFDFAVMRMYLLGKIKEFDSDKSIKAADVNGDGEFNSLDFALMKKYLLGKIKEFPVNQNSTPTPSVTATPTALPSEFSKIKPSIIDVRMSDLNRNNVLLVWNKVEGAILYEVFRDDVSIGTTSNAYFADSSVVEGINHIYRIRGINIQGESSQYSPSVMVNTLDTVLDSDTVLSEDRYYLNLNIEEGAEIDLNGYVLNVKGDLLQIKGIVNINSGSLKIDGNYSIYEDGFLEMTKEKDYVFVGGNFSMRSIFAGNIKDYVFPDDLLSAGILEIKGNMTGEDFRAKGSHKVVLSGEQIQEVDRIIQINELEIRNDKGVKILCSISINKMKGNYKVIGKLSLLGNVILIGDVTVEGDLELLSGELDLAGYSLKVIGNFVQYAEFYITYVRINGGNLEINGDYSMYSNTYEINSDTYTWESVLEMNGIDDYVYVGAFL